VEPEETIAWQKLSKQFPTAKCTYNSIRTVGCDIFYWVHVVSDERTVGD
jgi:hypothetical protein